MTCPPASVASVIDAEDVVRWPPAAEGAQLG
jgi:hypothetical protein